MGKLTIDIEKYENEGNIFFTWDGLDSITRVYYESGPYVFDFIVNGTSHLYIEGALMQFMHESNFLESLEDGKYTFIQYFDGSTLNIDFKPVKKPIKRFMKFEDVIPKKRHYNDQFQI